MSFFNELDRINVFRVAIADLVAWWLLLYIVDMLGAILKLPSSAGIVSERSEVSSELALRLSEALGRSPESWLAMQDNYDLWQARHSANLSQVRKILFEVNA